MVAKKAVREKIIFFSDSGQENSIAQKKIKTTTILKKIREGEKKREATQRKVKKEKSNHLSFLT